MKRILFFTLALCFLPVAASLARAQTKDSTVRYRDPTSEKDASVVGTITRDSPAGIVVKPTSGKGAERDIPASRILAVDYPAPTATLSIELRAARTAENAGNIDKALAQYQALLPKMAESPLKRHTEYLVAKLTARLAQRDRAQVKPALDRLLAFQKKHADSWEIGSLLDLLVPLQVAQKDLAGAQKTLSDLAQIADLPAEVRLECNIQGAKLLVEDKKLGEAEKKITDLLRMAKDRPAARLRIALAECKTAGAQLAEAQKELESLLPQLSDPESKAYAHNALGDCYQRQGELKKAMWNYLYVDVLYAQNKQEQARALYNLARVFSGLKEEDKARQCREALERDPRFAGKYQELIRAEQ